MLLIVFIADLIRHPLSARSIEQEMYNKNIISFIDIHGSRAYVVYEDGNYVTYLYRIATLVNMFRFQGRVELDRNAPQRSTAIWGRWAYFVVVFEGLNVSYLPGNNSRFLLGRFDRTLTILSSFIMINVGAFSVYKKFFEPRIVD